MSQIGNLYIVHYICMRFLLASLGCIALVLSGAGKVLASAPSEFQISHQNFIRSNQKYFGSDFNQDQLSTVGLDLNIDRESSRSKTELHVVPFYSFNESTFYTNLSEFYHTFKTDSADISLGRKKNNWSVADETWKTGLWQPQFRWDRMRQESQGLTGFLFERPISKKHKVNAFVSPIFIPDDLVDFREENGKFVSENPWFKPPPNRAKVFGVDNEIYAYLETPDIASVVLNPSIAFQYEYEMNKFNTFSFAYGYKPINQILNSLAYKFLIAGVDDSGVELKIYPFVAYHHLLTTEHRFEDRYFTNNLSATLEKPTRLLENEDIVYQRISDAVTLSWLGSYALSGEGDSAFRVYGGYMRTFGGYEADGGDVFDSGTQFEIRQRYLSVFKTGLSYPVWNKTRRVRNNIEANYDTIINGGTVLSEVEVAFTDHLFFSTSVDLIGVFETNEGTKKSNFINTYRANDRVQLRLSYVY